MVHNRSLGNPPTTHQQSQSVTAALYEEGSMAVSLPARFPPPQILPISLCLPALGSVEHGQILGSDAATPWMLCQPHGFLLPSRTQPGHRTCSRAPLPRRLHSWDQILLQTDSICVSLPAMLQLWNLHIKTAAPLHTVQMEAVWKRIWSQLCAVWGWSALPAVTQSSAQYTLPFWPLYTAF